MIKFMLKVKNTGIKKPFYAESTYLAQLEAIRLLRKMVYREGDVWIWNEDEKKYYMYSTVRVEKEEKIG